MALINCPECGKVNVSDSAQACPDCGFGIRDHFLKLEQQRAAVALAARKALEKKQAEEKAQKEREERIQSVKMPDKPKKPYLMVSSCTIIGFMNIIVAFMIGFSFWLFALGCFCLLLSFAGISNYNNEVQKYELALKDFEKYQKTVVQEEDRARTEAMRAARQKYQQSTSVPKCPKCGSTYISTVNRGYSLVWGFVGSGNAVNVCQKCGYKFKPGK